MNLILSNEAAKKLRIEQHSIKDFILDVDTWRIDCASLIKRSIFIITDEKTLYTSISSYKDGFSGIIKKIASTTMQNNLDINDIDFVKLQNRSIVGSMNNMKQIIKQFDKYSPSDNETYEKLINQTPFKCLSYLSPAEVYSSGTPAHLVD